MKVEFQIFRGCCKRNPHIALLQSAYLWYGETIPSKSTKILRAYVWCEAKFPQRRACQLKALKRSLREGTPCSRSSSLTFQRGCVVTCATTELMRTKILHGTSANTRSKGDNNVPSPTIKTKNCSTILFGTWKNDRGSFRHPKVYGRSKYPART